MYSDTIEQQYSNQQRLRELAGMPEGNEDQIIQEHRAKINELLKPFKKEYRKAFEDILLYVPLEKLTEVFQENLQNILSMNKQTENKQTENTEASKKEMKEFYQNKEKNIQIKIDSLFNNFGESLRKMNNSHHDALNEIIKVTDFNDLTFFLRDMKEQSIKQFTKEITELEEKTSREVELLKGCRKNIKELTE